MVCQNRRSAQTANSLRIAPNAARAGEFPVVSPGGFRQGAPHNRFGFPMSEEQVKKGRGCFFYGCLTVVVLVLVAALGLFFGARYFINRTIEKYTDTGPMTLPKVEVSAPEAAVIQDRVKAFEAALQTGSPTEALVLTEKDLNTLISASPDFAALNGKVYVSIAGEQIKGQISIPLDQFPIGRTAGRYLNGSAGIRLAMNNGVLTATLESLEVKGQPVSEQFMAGIRQQNLAKDAYNDVRKADMLRKLESIEVRDGHLEIKARAGK